MQTVSLTAQWTAAVRAAEMDYGKERLFTDTYAHALAEPDGFELLDRYHGAGVREFVAIRTRYFDDEIMQLINHREIDQVVFIAAGMDTRTLRLPWPQTIKAYEVDHKALLDEKHQRLESLDVPQSPHRVEVAADLTQDWLPTLVDHGFDNQRKTLWVAEGLLFFLCPETVSALLNTLQAAAPDGSHLLTDAPSQSLLNSPASAMFLSSLKNDGIPWMFGVDEPDEFLLHHGWQAIDIKEPGETDSGKFRWPYAVVDKTVKGASRSWLIHAVKCNSGI